MAYVRLKPNEFFEKISTEEEARELLWKAKFAGKDFICPGCANESFYQYRTRPEVRKCRSCGKQVRLRSGTILQDSKKPVLQWLRAIFFTTQDKRGVSALQLKRMLGMKSYGTVWTMLHKIREALRQRDEQYKLTDVIELDGAHFGREARGGAAEVLVAIETKSWVDERGRRKEKAGFAKVVVAPENKEAPQEFADQAFEPGSQVKTDGSFVLRTIQGVPVAYEVTGGIPAVLDRWLPWVHKFIANAKTWLLGTYHGVGAEYLPHYLAEYTYRFNRRHDPNGLLHRAVTACAVAEPVTAGALFR